MGIEDTLDKIVNMLEDLTQKVNNIQNRLSVIENNIGSGSAVSASAGGEAAGKAPSEVVMEQKLGPSASKAEGRLVCPKCGSTSIQEIEDKENPISYMGGVAIYGKKHYCKKCGHQWK